MYDIILFDLDGTITDSAPGITHSVQYALRKFGIDETDPEKLLRFVGPPLIDSYMRFYGLTKEQAQDGVTYYREYFVGQNGMFENNIYEGVPEMLETLLKQGKRVLMATSKPELFARQIMDHFDLSKYFEYIGGAGMDESRTGKAAVIEYVLETVGITDRSKVVMVGDREHDVKGAAKCGLPCIGVLYGYGSREELEGAGASAIAESVEALPGLV